MARKSTKKQADNDAQDNEVQEASGDVVIADVNSVAIKALKKLGKERGFVTHDELNKALPQGELTSEQIEDVMADLDSMGVKVVDHADDVEEDESEESEKSTGNLSDESRGSDDPVRMYLREMGTVELLTREGEIAIAKRIEAGRELLLGGICESPLTIRALLAWRDQIDTGEVLLRDLIDLDSTFTRANSDGVIDEESGLPAELGSGDVMETASGVEDDDEDDEEQESAEGEENAEGSSDDSSNDGESDELSMSLSAMEDAVREDVLKLIDDVAATFKELSTLRDRRLSTIKRGSQPSLKTETRYQELRIKLIEQMDGVLLSVDRIEALMEQLFKLNKDLSSAEGKLMRLAEKCGVKRPQFLQQWSAMS